MRPGNVTPKLGASVEAVDSMGRSALHHAVTPRGSDAIVSLLLDAGADPYLADNAGITPRMMAVDKKYTEGVPHPSDVDEAQVQIDACAYMYFNVCTCVHIHISYIFHKCISMYEIYV